MTDRLVRGVFFGLVAVGLVAIGWWAVSVAVEPPGDPLANREPVTYTVAVDTVGRSFRFSAAASWPFVDLGRNSAVGVVTSIVVDPGQLVAPGDVVYTVNLRPVVVAEGEVPAFRDLGLRTVGADVAQLQVLLADLGFYVGEADGVFDAGVRAAVRRWQVSLGVADDGVVRRGDVVFVLGLPARVLLDPEVVVGSPLSGGEVLLRRVVEEVDFVVVLAGGQRNLVPLDAAVNVTHGGRVWPARISDVVENQLTGEVVLHLVGVDGGPVCGGDCVDAVPLGDRVLFPAEVVVVPEVTGPAVPVAAIVTRPDGTTVVRLAGGGEVEVVVLASANAMAVVEGVEAGDVVLLPVEVER